MDRSDVRMKMSAGMPGTSRTPVKPVSLAEWSSQDRFFRAS
jgi:hypothetical protein